MNRITTTLFTGLFALVLVACTGPAKDSNRAAQNAAAQTNGAASQNQNRSLANANLASSSSSANSNAANGALDASKLVGTYNLNQIQKGGVTTMMSAAKVQLVFTADGRYTRAITTSEGKLVHNESGQFDLTGDKLTFKVILTGKTINPTPKVKDYTVALSPDGRELKLTSPTGETAVFYRAA